MQDDVVVFAEAAGVDRRLAADAAGERRLLDVQPLAGIGVGAQIRHLVVVQEHQVFALARHLDRPDQRARRARPLDAAVDYLQIKHLGAVGIDRRIIRRRAGAKNPPGGGRGDGVAAAVAPVGHQRVAGEMVEHRGVEPVGEPVLQPHLGFVAQAERHTLGVDGVLVAHAHGMRELVEYDLVRIGGEAFLVAHQGLRLGHSVAGKLHAQPEGDGVAGVGRALGLHVDHAVGRGAHELAEVGFLQRFRGQFLRPQLVGE